MKLLVGLNVIWPVAGLNTTVPSEALLTLTTVSVPPSGSVSLASTWAVVTVIAVLTAVAERVGAHGRRVVDRRVVDRHQAAVVLVAADQLVLEFGVAREVLVRIERDAAVAIEHHRAARRIERLRDRQRPLSGLKSLPVSSAAIKVTVASSTRVNLSSTGEAVSGSLDTITVTVAVSVPPLPSLIVYLNVSVPKKSPLGV